MPIPASPTTRIAPPRPVVAQRSSRARIRARSASRPTSGPVTGIRKCRGRPTSVPPPADGCPTGLRLAAEDHRSPVGHAQPSARRVERGRVEEDLAAPGDRLDAGRGRDRGAGHGEVVGAAAVAGGRDDLAGRDPDPDLERLAVGRHARERVADREGGEGRTDGVVVMGPRPPEDREDRVADELLAGPVVRLDRVGHRGERGPHPLADDLGVVLGHHPHVVHEVGEQRGDDPPVARLADRRRTAGAAPRRRRRSRNARRTARRSPAGRRTCHIAPVGAPSSARSSGSLARPRRRRPARNRARRRSGPVARRSARCAR